MKALKGGVCAAQGFKAAGIHCGIRRNHSKKDLALVVSDVPASAAGVYTQNRVKGAPLLVTQKNLANGRAQAIICNSGNANTCNPNGAEIAEGMCNLVEKWTKVPAGDVIVASTGVIGQAMTLEPIAAGMEALTGTLSANGGLAAAQAIMTTDTHDKQAAVEFELGGRKCVLGGMAKGSGMIHPNMATMLVFLTTDAAISPEMLSKALKSDVKRSFNMLSIDGDTSTNDMVCVMANGLAGNDEIIAEGADYDLFCEALKTITQALCRLIAKDGEGASKLLTCHVSGAADEETARTAAKSVICSTLLKAAMFGADANWGRVLCAIGYSGAEIDISKVDIAFASSAGTIPVCLHGTPLNFSEELAKKILLADEISIEVDLNDGAEEAIAWGCDLTYDYVRINGDYRT